MCQYRFTTAEIRDMIAQCSMTSLVRGIVDKGRATFWQGMIVLHCKQDANGKCWFINMGLDNPVTLRTDQYQFSIDQFISMIDYLKEKRSETVKTDARFADHRDEALKTIETLHREIVDFLHNLQNTENNADIL